MAKHRRTPETQVVESPSGGRHRAQKEKSRLGVNVAMAIGLGAVVGTTLIGTHMAENKPTGASQPDTDPTQAPASHTPAPATKAPKPTPGNKDRSKYGDCPAPDTALVARYSNHKAVPTPNIARFDTDKSVETIKKLSRAKEMLDEANAALDGKIVVRFATEQDYSVPTDNYDMTDRPLPSSAEYTAPNVARAAITGVLEAYDDMPEDLGTLRGYPLSVVLTDQIVTPDPKDSPNVIGGFNGEDGQKGYLMLRLGETTEATNITTKHETGHYVHEAGTGSMPDVDCFMDPYLTHPDQLTQYSMDNPGEREAAADDFAIAEGAHFRDQYPHATTDQTNANNFAVLMGRVAGLGPQEEKVADALYDQSVFAQ